MPFLVKVALAAQNVLLPLGGWGLFVAAALDSSFLSFAGGVDLWLVSVCALRPSQMPLYALAATVGSVIGCSALYVAVRKGEEALLERNRSTPRFAHVRSFMESYGAWSLFVVSFLPPPTPFKLFVLAAGLLQLPYRKFVIALVVGRSLRYFVEGLLVVWYGRQVWDWMIRSGPVLFGLAIVALALLVLGRRFRRLSPSVTTHN